MYTFKTIRTPVVSQKKCTCEKSLFENYNYKRPELFITTVLNTTGRQLHRISH